MNDNDDVHQGADDMNQPLPNSTINNNTIVSNANQPGRQIGGSHYSTNSAVCLDPILTTE